MAIIQYRTPGHVLPHNSPLVHKVSKPHADGQILLHHSVELSQFTLYDRYHHYLDDMASRFTKMTQRLRVELKSQKIKWSNLISISSFLSPFRVGLMWVQEYDYFHFSWRKRPQLYSTQVPVCLARAAFAKEGYWRHTVNSPIICQ